MPVPGPNRRLSVGRTDAATTRRIYLRPQWSGDAWIDVDAAGTVTATSGDWGVPVLQPGVRLLGFNFPEDWGIPEQPGISFDEFSKGYRVSGRHPIFHDGREAFSIDYVVVETYSYGPIEFSAGALSYWIGKTIYARLVDEIRGSEREPIAGRLTGVVERVDKHSLVLHFEGGLTLEVGGATVTKLLIAVAPDLRPEELFRSTL
ncbi:hypothetical protein [Gryllotalpicola protaetiae]|uniref:Uncharacterized protein n=1 Tax=Gryllotalpicola protaetiae TaxID=2419771 RepID=A0A387BWR2_9MICO|nr:hypothetical protein [Gryllotalpicola protaetiae]AYG05556.1 hypothetical protein D7I44_17925 [Gryllotalpicola protaetiae]